MSKLPVKFPALESLGFTESGFRFLLNTVGQMFTRVAVAFNNPEQGTTAARPTFELVIGQTYFDTTLGLAIWWDGAQWVDATGAPV